MIELVGMHHRAQIMKGRSGENFTQSVATRFKRIAPILVGEEAEAELDLKFYGISATVPQRAAALIGVEHRLCDVGLVERVKLGWKPRVDFPTMDDYYAYLNPLREQKWFDRIQDKLDGGNVVFVCGREHIYNFAMLLANHGHEVHFTLADLNDRSRLRVRS